LWCMLSSCASPCQTQCDCGCWLSHTAWVRMNGWAFGHTAAGLTVLVTENDNRWLHVLRLSCSAAAAPTHTLYCQALHCHTNLGHQGQTTANNPSKLLNRSHSGACCCHNWCIYVSIYMGSAFHLEDPEMWGKVHSATRLSVTEGPPSQPHPPICK
jgi:hypothetical protein